MIVVELSDEQVVEADAEGIRRSARDRPHRVYDPGPDKGREQDIRAARSELAVAVALGLEWTGKGEGARGRRDVGDTYEVRAVDEPRLGLIVRWGDREAPFVLALVEGRRVTLSGWYWASAARVDRFIRSASSKAPGSFWVVPPDALNPMATLPAPAPTVADLIRYLRRSA